jgi:dienelactone hydrolase
VTRRRARADGARASAAFLLLALTLAWPAQGAGAFPPIWPDPADVSGRLVSFPSRSPFTPADIGADDERNPPAQAIATLFLPDGASKARPVPAVVMLHGSGGVLYARELTYGRQFAAMGVAALVVDAFAARRDRASSFTERLINITESMLLADAYAALDWLGERPDIDAERVALIGFSYGGMATLYAAQAQLAERLAPRGRRFAAHIAFYAPCVARFEDRRATGKPVLMLVGGEDQIIDRGRCAEVAADLRHGGAEVEMIVYPGAYHQWDGGFSGPRRIGRNLAPCRLKVESDGTVRDRHSWLPMVDAFTRKLILWLCTSDEGYLIGRDDAVRARSNADLGRFLTRIFGTAAE